MGSSGKSYSLALEILNHASTSYTPISLVLADKSRVPIHCVSYYEQGGVVIDFRKIICFRNFPNGYEIDMYCMYVESNNMKRIEFSV